MECEGWQGEGEEGGGGGGGEGCRIRGKEGGDMEERRRGGLLACRAVCTRRLSSTALLKRLQESALA